MQWEYKFITYMIEPGIGEQEMIDSVNGLGKEGWEMISQTAIPMQSTRLVGSPQIVINAITIFKRPIKGEGINLGIVGKIATNNS